MRPTKQQTFMSIAHTWAALSTCSSRVAVGAVLVNSYGHIIASGYNGSPRGFPHCDEVGCILDEDKHCTRAIHAEQNVIIQCAIVGTPCNGSTLYVTHSPCPRCALIIVQSGIVKVVYQTGYRGAFATEEIFRDAHITLERIGS